MRETGILSPEQEAKKEVWLKELALFVVEANSHTYATGGGEVSPQRPGYTELEHQKGDWLLRDSYVGHFRAPGMTTVYFKGQPAWTMAYGGVGTQPGKYETTKESFGFLKSALVLATPELPYRGPKKYEKDGRRYEMDVRGGLDEFDGSERIFNGDDLEFSQLFFGGIVISRDSNRELIYPWNL